MFRFLKNRAFGKFVQSKPYTDKGLRKVANWDDIKSIGFLIDGADATSLRLLLNKLYDYTDKGKKVDFLGYVKKYPPFEDEPIVWITRKDLNWFGAPKIKKIKVFLEKEFDILITTSLQNGIRPLEFVSTYSKATLRIGPFDPKKTYCYDFMIDVKNNKDPIPYLEQIERYLKMVKT